MKLVVTMQAGHIFLSDRRKIKNSQKNFEDKMLSNYFSVSIILNMSLVVH